MDIPHGTAPSTESPLSVCLVQDEIRFIITYFTKQNIFVATREIREGPKRKEWISIGILLGFLKQESRVIEPKESSWRIDTVWCHRSLIFLLVTKPSHDDRNGIIWHCKLSSSKGSSSMESSQKYHNVVIYGVLASEVRMREGCLDFSCIIFVFGCLWCLCLSLGVSGCLWVSLDVFERRVVEREKGG
ncbi:hypothetical protein BDC45DRAFT_535205 [Circinella umbellata]|nr:hypothetical protein BDC45DRAFT_535205 [Circinella umbellata]